MATATTNGSTVIKPDHAAERKHMIFTQEHEDLRESMQAWVKKELWPHRNEWEETTWPSEVLKRAGELGFLGLCFPEEYGGQGGDYYYSLVRAECMSYSGSGGLNMGFAVHTDMVAAADRAARHRGAEAALPAAGRSGARRSAASGSPSPGPAPTSPASAPRRSATATNTSSTARRRSSPTAPAPTSSCSSPRPTPTTRHDGMSLFVVDLRDENGEKVPGFSVSAQAGEDGDARLRHRRARLRGRPRPGRAPCSARRARASTTSPGSSRASGWSPPPAAVAGRERMFEKTLEYAKEREAFGRPIGKFQAIRHKFAEMATKIEAAKQFTYATAWRFANGEYPVREITMAKLFASRIACEVADECIQILGGYGYMKEYEIERAYRDVRLNRIGAGTDEIMLDVIGRSYGL